MAPSRYFFLSLIPLGDLPASAFLSFSKWEFSWWFVKLRIPLIFQSTFFTYPTRVLPKTQSSSIITIRITHSCLLFSLSLSVSSWSLPSLFSRRRRLSLFFSLNIRIIIPSRSNLHYNVPPPSTHSRKTIFSYYASLFFLSLCLKLVGKLWTTDRVKRKREENAEEEQGKESVPMRGWW